MKIIVNKQEVTHITSVCLAMSKLLGNITQDANFRRDTDAFEAACILVQHTSQKQLTYFAGIATTITPVDGGGLEIELDEIGVRLAAQHTAWKVNHGGWKRLISSLFGLVESFCTMSMLRASDADVDIAKAAAWIKANEVKGLVWGVFLDYFTPQLQRQYGEEGFKVEITQQIDLLNANGHDGTTGFTEQELRKLAWVLLAMKNRSEFSTNSKLAEMRKEMQEFVHLNKILAE